MSVSLLPPADPRVLLRLDPRTKLALLIAANVVVLSGNAKLPTVAAVGIAFVLFFSAQMWKTACRYLIILAGLWGLWELLSLWPGQITFGLALISYFAVKYSAVIAIAVYVMRTTRPGEFIAAMTRMRVPIAVTIPLSVTFRFLPAIADEFRAIVQAMRLRNVYGGYLGFIIHPIRILEYVLVPLLTSVVRIGEELSASALTRGLGSPGVNTSIYPIGFSKNDLLGLLVVIGLIVLGVLSELGVV